jgi:KDO2-lipid IV(A) lauroyltransferase
MKHIFELAGFFLLSAPLAILPLGIAVRVGRALGSLTYMLWGSRRRITVENLRRAKQRGAIDDPRSAEELARETFRNLGRWVAEITRSYFGRGDALIREIEVQGLEHYRVALDKGKGVIFVSGHCGNWELLMLSFAEKIGPIVGVARKQSNPYLDRFITRARSRYKSEVVYKEGALRKFISRLKEGGSVGVLMDQSVLPEEGVLIDFLGAPAWNTKMPVALARRTGAALLPVFIKATESGHEIAIHPDAELSSDDIADTKRLSSYVEDFIKSNPTQWLWIHRKWKRVPEGMGSD